MAESGRESPAQPVAPLPQALRLGALALALAAGLVILVPSSYAQTQTVETSSVLVQVNDETGRPVPESEVFLLVSDGQEIISQLTATTGADGTATFTDIAFVQGYTALAITDYLGAPYQAERAPLSAGQQAVVPITVFNVSAAQGNLHFDSLHIVMNAVGPGVFQAIQVVSVLNVGDAASLAGPEVGDRRAGLIIPVPAGATNVGLVPQMSGLDPASLVIETDRVLDLRPVPPGNHQIAIQYEILTGADGRDFELHLPYPTSQVSLLVGPGLESVEVQSNQMTELSPEEIPGQGVYAHWTSDVMSPDTTVLFHVGPRRAVMSITTWSLLALAVALFAAATASLWSSRRSQPAHDAPDPPDRDRLIAEVARLDADHDAGRIGEADYRAQRGAAIDRLMELDSGPGADARASGE